MKKAIFILFVLLLILIAGSYFLFNSKEDPKSQQESSFEEDNLPVAESKNMKAVIETNYGEIELELFSSLAPKTVDNFAKLARAGFYNGVKFHRVMKGFMIQGGDPFTINDSLRAKWGTGGPGYIFEDEIHAENKNVIGSISMANAGPDTNGSQFFINTANNNFLDKKHTAFGKVLKGMEVVSAIENLPTDGNDCPAAPVIIKNIQIIGE